MAKSKSAPQPVAEVLTRQSIVTFKPVIVKLSELDHATKRHLFCHRSDIALKYNPDPSESTDPEDPEAAMRMMVDSLQLEGQQVPVEYYIDIDLGTRILIRGYRRIEAIHTIIERRIAPDLFSLEMDISAIEVESPVGFLDYLIRSICDNEVRLGLTDPEKLLAAEKALKGGASSSRAARALGVSATHFARYQRRIASPTMRAHIAANHLTATSADNLLELASRNNSIGQLESDFDNIVHKIEDHINSLRAEAILSQNEFDEDKFGEVSKYINKGFLNAWMDGLKESKSLDWQAEPVANGWTYECGFDLKTGAIKIAALKKDAHTMSYQDLGQLSGKLSVLAKKVENWWLKKQAEHRIWATAELAAEDEDLIDYYARHHAEDLANPLRAKAAMAHGEADPSHGTVTPRDETVLADAITVPTAPEQAPYDPVIDGGPVGPVQAPPTEPASTDQRRSSRRSK